MLEDGGKYGSDKDVYIFYVTRGERFEIHFKAVDPSNDINASNFIRLWINDNLLTLDVDYTVEDGSIKITLASQILDDLRRGPPPHMMRLEYSKDGNHYIDEYPFIIEDNRPAPTPTPRSMPRPTPRPSSTPTTVLTPTPRPPTPTAAPTSSEEVKVFNESPAPMPTRQPTPTPMPTRQPTPTATPTPTLIPLPESIQHIVDLPTSELYSPSFIQSVASVIEDRIMRVITYTKFAPTVPATADMVSTSLARMLHVNLSEISMSGSMLLTPSMVWANSIGLFEGIIRPSPYMRITRGQLMVMIIRFLVHTNAVIPEGFVNEAFVDAGEMTGDEFYAFQRLYHMGIIQGRGNLVMDPRTVATRGELAIVLSNTKGHMGDANREVGENPYKTYEPRLLMRFLLMYAPEDFRSAFKGFLAE